MEFDTLIQIVRESWPYLLASGTAAGVLAWAYVNHTIDGFARSVVGAVYRAALRTANELADDSAVWLRSEDGINYRKALAQKAYDAIPASIGPIPVGLIKLVIPQATFDRLVQNAFDEICELADRLQ